MTTNDDIENQVESMLNDSNSNELIKICLELDIVADPNWQRIKILKAIRGYISTEQSALEQEGDAQKIAMFWTELKDSIAKHQENHGHVQTNIQDQEHGEHSDDSENNGNKLVEALQNLLLINGNRSNNQSGKDNQFKRSLKISGTIGDKEGMNYTNLLSEINDARESGYTDIQIKVAVKKAISPNCDLRTYFDSMDNISLSSMLKTIRSLLNEKDSAELFGELSTVVQNPQEEATAFVIRCLQLKNRVNSANKLEGGLYDIKLVASTFNRAVRTGLVNDNIRNHMKPFLLDQATVLDEELLQQVRTASAEVDEVANKIKKARKVTVNESSVVSTSMDTNAAILKAIQHLAKQVEGMNKHKHTKDTSKKPYFPDRRCQECKTKDMRCIHCFNCGSSKHQQRDCDQTDKVHCFKCGSSKHQSENCNQMNKNSNDQNNGYKSTNNGSKNGY